MRAAIPAGQNVWLAMVAVGVPLSGWGASYPPNTWLQVGPVATVVLALRRWPLLPALSMDLAAAYNGQQGDVFDSAEDMAMAGLGTILWIGGWIGRRLGDSGRT